MCMKKQQRQKGKFKIIRIIMPLFDLIILNLASFMALWVRFEFDLQALSQEVFLENVLYFAPFYTIISLCIFAGMRLYNSLWEFANIDEIFKIICASLLAVLVQTILMYVFDVRYLYGVELSLIHIFCNCVNRLAQRTVLPDFYIILSLCTNYYSII